MEDIHVPIRHPEIKFTKLFINNVFVNSVSGKTFPTFNPATEEKITDVQEGDKDDVDKAVAAAKQAFKCGSPWRRTDASKRCRMLNKLANLIVDNMAYLASLETLNNGKPYHMAIDDMRFSVEVLRYFAGWSDKYQGKIIPVDGDFLCYTIHEPVGICGHLIPWSCPVLVFIWKLAPTLALGNVVVIKAAEQTPLTALYFASLIKEAGFPPGVVNVLTGYGTTAGVAISSHPDIDKVTFTGSTEGGKSIMRSAGASNLKGTTIKLSAKNPIVIFPDAKNLDKVVEIAHLAAMANMGQCSIAGSRTFVHEDIYDEFVDKSVERAKKQTVGDPFDDNESGPLIDGKHLEKVLGMVKTAEQDGAKLECGGRKHGDKGYFVQPTVFTGVTDDMEIAKEEVFGPVQCIFKFKTTEEVIKRANDTKYGISAGVFTNDMNTALTCTRRIKAGSVWVNSYGDVKAQAPFGGYKMSGIGRECGEYGLQQYTEVKSVMFKTPIKMI